MLPPNQYEFTDNTLAVTALSQLKSSIQKAINDRKKGIVISVYIKNAFGPISANIINRRFKNVNVLENIRILTGDLLQNRKITYQTSAKNVSVRFSQKAPQGSPLRPFFVNLTISELRHKLPFGASIQTLADELTILMQGKTQQEIENIAKETFSLMKE